MGREFELKYAATPDVLQQIRESVSDFTVIAMETTYFDTPSRALSKRKITLRLRKENNTLVCTLKTPLPDGSRGEWECPADSIQSGLQQLLALGAPSQIIALADEGLKRVCGAKFTRLAARIDLPDGAAELALDQGILLGGEKQIPLCEVEIEQKSCSEASAIAYAHALAQQYGLRPEENSKFRRASALAQGE